MSIGKSDTKMMSWKRNPLTWCCLDRSSKLRWDTATANLNNTNNDVAYIQHIVEIFSPTYRLVFLTVPPHFQFQNENKNLLFPWGAFFKSKISFKKLWLTIFRLSFWYWKSGGTVKNILYVFGAPLYQAIWWTILSSIAVCVTSYWISIDVRKVVLPPL